ncbi:L-threonylcarbamoyladenylate synthase [Paenibacillus sp. J22TS3]|uniref:L-threonylcarbamoyladenylate synthase n=1 Tax=Paenibacillus sp. J22TS3 TaxID=2807192 RepID=UPI001B1C8198|nr:threonylcarbamoyl-AMP synthase [Paenibacillus sp. J22TS3]
MEHDHELKQNKGKSQDNQTATKYWDVTGLIVNPEAGRESEKGGLEQQANGRLSNRERTTEKPSAEERLIQEQYARERSAEQSILEAAAMLRAGQTVAFPTETVYGLGADARSTEAVERIFAAKGRPSDNPLIVHIAELSQLDELVLEVNDTARRLMEAYWPGPLTLVLPVRPGAVSPRVTAGLSTVAVRMPAHDIALRLIAAAGCPVAAPSANRSGRPSPTLASHVGEDLAGLIGGIVDGGPTGVGLESTVAEAGADGTVTVLRPGAVTEEALARVAASVHTDPALRSGGDADSSPAPRSPGMKYTHYAPQGSLRIVRGDDPAAVTRRVQELLTAAEARGEVTGVLAYDEHLPQYRASVVISLGPLGALENAAHRLYAGLRRFDEEGATFMVAEACPEEGLGQAVMNRLLKAAGNEVIDV